MGFVTTQPGAGGEIQLTDALDALLGLETFEAYQLIGRSHDCGTKLGYLKANVIYGVRHASVGAEFDAANPTPGSSHDHERRPASESSARPTSSETAQISAAEA